MGGLVAQEGGLHVYKKGFLQNNFFKNPDDLHKTVKIRIPSSRFRSPFLSAQTDEMPEHPHARHRVQVGVTAQRIADHRTISVVADADTPGEPVGKPRVPAQHHVRVMELVAPERCFAQR
jgi:hypothetical protein